MILKIIKKKDIQIDEVNIDGYSTDYIFNIKEMNRFEPCLEQQVETTDSIEILFNDGSTRIITLGIIKDNTYINQYNSVFLMNDEGKTIERLT